MKYLEKSGKTVEIAIDLAISELGLQKDEVDIEILDEGSRGFLNLFNTKDAKVRVKVKRNPTNEVKKYISDILNAIGVIVEINAYNENGKVKIDITGKNLGTIIGNKGETLDSLQFLANLYINKDKSLDYVKVDLDIGGYKAKREESLLELAELNANKARETDKRIVMKPMNAYERRIIHSHLQNVDDIETFSEGKEPFRKIIIQKKKV